MNPDHSGAYGQLHPDKTSVSITLAKVFILAAGLAVAAFTLGGAYADQRLKLRGIEVRLDDLPTKMEVRQAIEAGNRVLDARLRAALQAATFRCPLFKGRGKDTWVECKVMFGPAAE
jgi:hypothetical protein